MNALLKQDLAGPLALMDTVFAASGALAAEYPLVFQKGFDGRVVALGDDGATHSACAVLSRQLVLGGTRIPIGLIGCVATDPTYRRRGLGASVLEQAEAWLAHSGALFSLLWADDPRLYLARGYRPVGVETDVLLPRSSAEAFETFSDYREIEARDVPTLRALYSAHERRMVRSNREMAALLGCPGMRTLVATEDDQPIAYACLGRGRDLKGVVHEWAGEPRAVLGLIRALARECEVETLVVMAPGGSHAVIKGLCQRGASAHVGYLGLAKLLDPSGAAALLQSIAGGSVELESDGRRVAWRGPKGTLRFESAALLDLLFAPRGKSELLGQARETTGLDLRSLPLDPFCWGLDSL